MSLGNLAARLRAVIASFQDDMVKWVRRQDIKLRTKIYMAGLLKAEQSTEPHNLSDLLLCRWSEDGEGPVFYNEWNFNREVLRRFGKFLPTYSEYIASLSERGAFTGKIKEHYFIELAAPEPLCLVELMDKPPSLTHCGVVLDDNKRFIHIEARKGVTMHRLDDKRWASRIVGYYRYVPKINFKDNKVLSICHQS